MKYSSILLAVSALVAFPPTSHAASATAVTHLRCEYLANPLGIDAVHPRLSWQLTSDVRGERQTAYEVVVASSPAMVRAGRGDLWDSGKVSSDRSTEIMYAGKPLRSAQRCWWSVRVWDQAGKPVTAIPAYFQMGLLKPADWSAKWIAAEVKRNVDPNGNTLPPPPYFRKSFTVTKPVKHATVFASARGVYDLHLNGAKVGDAVLAPGWTDYRKRVEYQTYDVTSSIHQGANMVGAILGDGWYSGYVGFSRRRDNYGEQPELRLQLNIEYADGTRQTIGTDNSWRATTGAIHYSDMLQGEFYDARKELAGWDRPGAATGAAPWRPVFLPSMTMPATQRDVTAQLSAAVRSNRLSIVAGNSIAGDPAYNRVKRLRVDYTLNGKPHTQFAGENATLQIPGPGESPGALVIRRAVYGVLEDPFGPVKMVGVHGPPIRVTEHLAPKRITQLAGGKYLVDMGQNMVGWARLSLKAGAGTKVQMRFAEMLSKDGTIYTTNLRSAKATDTYICHGGGVETWEPHFTFHGFRYIEVSGYPGKLTPGALTGCVIGSDTPHAGTFTCSNLMVNQLQHNIVWGQRGNFISVPTDCPQRDERLGWMGDAQIFARTATYNRDVAGFYEKWMQDVEDGQSREGGFSDVSPRIVDDADGAPAWGDAGVIVPWTVYQAYGDLGLVRRHWTAMNRWMDYITSVNPNGLWLKRRNNDFGDWLSIAADTPKDLLATAYYAYDAQLMARMARALGRQDEASKYDRLFAHIRKAFNTAFVSPMGGVKGDTQTGYVLALRFGLMPDNLRKQAAQRLVDAIAAKNNHLSTGFVGVGYLCPVLTATGHNDVAYKLLFNDTFPSWGFSIKHGATTIWERWDGWTPEHGFQDPGMNSFNHYSLGSVGQWLYQDVAGIDTDPDHPGFKHILLHPQPGPGLTSATASYESIHGTIRSAWKAQNGEFLWTVTVPANTTATAWIPARSVAGIMEGGKPATQSAGARFVRMDGNAAMFELGSGTYQFRAR